MASEIKVELSDDKARTVVAREGRFSLTVRVVTELLLPLFTLLRVLLASLLVAVGRFLRRTGTGWVVTAAASKKLAYGACDNRCCALGDRLEATASETGGCEGALPI